MKGEGDKKKGGWYRQEIHISVFTLYEDKTLRLKGYYMKNSIVWNFYIGCK